MGTSNLIDARGDDDTFVYTYQNKSDDSEQVWVITVAAVENDGKDTTK